MKHILPIAALVLLKSACLPVLAEEPVATPAPSATAPAPTAAPEDSFPPFVNGKSTVDDVTAKFGRPTNEGHMMGPDGPYNYTYILQGGNVVIVFLFGKDNVLIRVRAYAKNP